MTDAHTQCDATYGGRRCELVHGHDSAHAIRSGAALVFWHNRQSIDHGSAVGSTWYAQEPTERPADSGG